MPPIVLLVPYFWKNFCKKALLSPVMEVIHNEEHAYLSSQLSIGIKGSFFIGYTTSSSSFDSVLNSIDVSSDIPSVPPSLPLLVSSQDIISMTITTTSSELRNALVSTSQLSSSCANDITTILSILHKIPSMPLSLLLLSLPSFSSLCAIVLSTTLSTSIKLPSMSLSLPPLWLWEVVVLGGELQVEGREDGDYEDKRKGVDGGGLMFHWL
ncbi:hypothetical protein ACFE04_018359 [Oxalis oulophora]